MYQWYENDDLGVVNLNNEIIIDDLTYADVTDMLNTLQRLKPLELPGLIRNISKRIELRLLYRICAELDYPIYIQTTPTRLSGRDNMLTQMNGIYREHANNLSQVKASISVIEMYKDINSSFETITGDMTDYDLESVTHFKQHRLPRVELQLIQNRFHKLAIAITNDKHICVVTNQPLTYATYRKLIAILPALVKPNNTATNKLIDLFRAYAEPTPDKFFKLCDEHYSFKTFQESIQEELNKAMFAEVMQSLTRNITNSLNSTINSIKNTLDDLATYESRRIAFQKQLADVENTMDKSLKDFMDYIKTNKSITSYRLSVDAGPALELFTKTAAVNYNPDEASQVILSPKATPLCPTRAEPAYKNLLIKTFVENKYTMIFCTKFVIYLSKLSGGLRSVSTADSAGLRTGNPHLVAFHCYGGAAATITKALAGADLITATSNILAANANINFFDTTVMEYLYDYITMGNIVMLDEEGNETTSGKLIEKERMLIDEANKTDTGNN